MVEFGNDYRLTTELDPFYSSSYYVQSGDPYYQVHSYVRLDGRMTLDSPDRHWSFDIIGKNLTNATIIDQPGLYYAAKQEPINVAVQLRMKW